LKCARPGVRFRRRYRLRLQRGRSYFAKPLNIMIGLCLLVTGVVLLVAPGPGFLVALVGAGMMAEESYGVAWLLDCIEIKLRRSLLRLRKMPGAKNATAGDTFSNAARSGVMGRGHLKSPVHLPH
jgi:putative transmembrane protein PGPGW